MNSTLFNAILSMDSYNRGYNASIILSGVGSKLGTATYITDSLQTPNTSAGQSAGFYASAYSYNGSTIISYRGTDNIWSLVGNDALTGWAGGVGFVTSQNGLAFAFYNDVAKSLNGNVAIDPRNANISLTGHSLGGGLAGLIGAVYNKSATMFDNMAFEAAAGRIQTLSDPLLAAASGYIYESALKQAVYGSYNGGVAWKPTTFSSTNPSLQTYYLENEILTINRVFQTSQKHMESLGIGVDLPGVTDAAMARHSMAALAISMYGDPSINAGMQTSWQAAGKYFWPVMYDNAFAGSFIPVGAVPGTMNTEGDFSGILQNIIAYSAIDEGLSNVSARPFGDTAIRAFYNDANDLGRALSLANVNPLLKSNATWISEAFVQYAGQLALSKVLSNANNAFVNDGIITFDNSPYGYNNPLDVSFSNNEWVTAGGGNLPNLVSRTNLFNGILTNIDDFGLIQDSIKKQMQSVWGTNTADNFEHFYFLSTTQTGGAAIWTDPINPNAFNFIIGSGSADSILGTVYNDLIYGGDGNDFIQGNLGNDVFIAGLGSDILRGSNGIDSISYSYLSNAVTVTNNIVAKGNGQDTLSFIDLIRLTDFNDVVTFDKALIGSYGIEGMKAEWSGGGGYDVFNVTKGFSYEIAFDMVTNAYFLGGRKNTFVDFEKLNIVAETLYVDENADISYSSSSLISTKNGIERNISLSSTGLFSGIDYSQAMHAATFHINDYPSLTVGPDNNSVVINGRTHDYGSYANGLYNGVSFRGTDQGDVVHIWSSQSSGGFITGKGNDAVYLEGTVSSNIIIYTGGNDIIYNSKNLAKIIFASDIAKSDVTSTAYGSGPTNVTITIKDHGTITLVDFTGFNDLAGEGLFYQNDKGLYIYGIQLNDTLIGAKDREQILFGFGGNDVLNGGNYNDQLFGGMGDDTYIFNIGDAGDTITELAPSLYDDGGSDLIKFGAGIHLSDLYVFREYHEGASLEYDLDILIFDGTGIDRILIKDQSTNPVENIQFSDGTLLNIKDEIPVIGTQMNDSLIGDSINNQLYGFGGNDTLDGGEGNDSAFYTSVYANYTVSGVGSVTVKDNVGSEGTDTLTNIEKIVFSNGVYQNGVFTANIPSNVSPVVVADSATVGQNSSVIISVLTNDSDANGDNLTVASVGAAAHGTATINANNTVTYTPTANYSGADSFTYTVSDGHGGTATQTVSVTVSAAGPNSAPVLGKDNVAVNQNSLITINVLANDSDSDGNAMVVTSLSAPAHGAAIINADNTVKYTPTTGYYGDDTFLYTVSDGHGGTATQRVNVTVNQVASTNVAPVAGADSVSVVQNGTVDISVLSNDTDANGDVLTVASVGAAAHGTAAINANNTVKYTPTANYSGADSFTYTVSDGHGGTATQTVNVTVSAAGPNSAPILGKDNVTVNQNSLIAINVLANDSDPDGNAMVVTSLSAPVHGAAIINADNTVKYTPTIGYYGDDTFLYTVSDGHGGTATQRVNVTVNQIAVTNVAPVAVADSATVAQNSSVIISVLANDSDANGDALTVATIGAAAHGAAVINANNTVTYTPTANYSGADSFTYTVSDGHGGTASQTVSLTVSSVTNVAPVLGKDNVSVNEDQTLVINVLANDSDANGDTLTVTSLSAPSHGAAVVNANNTVTYTPSANYYGDDTFLYTVNDGHGGEATQRINIAVNSVPDAMIEGTNNPETLIGTTASETIAGLGGADTLYGGTGNDTLYGGYGADVLYGQAGADVFSFDKNSAFSAIDTIKDFSISGGDKIDLKDLLVGYDAVTKAITDFVEFTTSGTNTIAKVDRDGTSTAYGWQQIATFENTTGLTDEVALKASGNLIVA